MAGPLNWLLVALAALIAGVFNLSVALKQFRAISKGLIFFEPLRSVGFWLWVLVQMLIPALAFLLWVTEFFEVFPTVEVMLFVKAVGLGVGFTAFLNARTETGFLTLNIQSIYESLSRVGFDLIARRETQRTSRFWRALEEELSKPYIALDGGLRNLRAYFRYDPSLKLPERIAEREKIITQITQVLETDQKDTRINLVLALLPEVRQGNIWEQLQGFRCSQYFLQTEIPPRFRPGIQGVKVRSHP